MFIDNLPGLPDNISPNARGNGYWVSFAVTRTWLTDYMAGLPTLRSLIVRVKDKFEHICKSFAQLCNQIFCRTLQSLMFIKFLGCSLELCKKVLMLPVFFGFTHILLFSTVGSGKGDSSLSPKTCTGPRAGLQREHRAESP